MGQAVQKRLGQGGIAADFRPATEPQVRGDADALPFVPIREELEERCSAGTQSQVAQFVDDHQVVSVVASEGYDGPRKRDSFWGGRSSMTKGAGKSYSPEFKAQAMRNLYGQ